MLRKQICTLWVTLACWMACAAALADGIDGPDMYVYVEVSVREITIEGMRTRLQLLQSPSYSVDADNAADAATRVRVAAVYAQFGTTAAAHASYGTRHAAQVKDWLEANPTWQERYTALDTQFRSLSNQLSALRNPQ